MKIPLPLMPATEAKLRELGRAVEPLFQVDEAEISRDAKGLYRRLQPEVTTNRRLLNAVPRLVASLLASLDWVAPGHDAHRKAIAAVWAEVERSLEDGRGVKEA